MGTAEANRKYDELQTIVSKAACEVGKRRPIYMDYDRNGRKKSKDPVQPERS